MGFVQSPCRTQAVQGIDGLFSMEDPCLPWPQEVGPGTKSPQLQADPGHLSSLLRVLHGGGVEKLSARVTQRQNAYARMFFDSG